jgi:glycosyltransferase involved in cell wall biosynthesis
MARARPDVIYPQRPEEIVAGIIGGRLARAPVVLHLHGFETLRRVVLAGRFGVRYIAVSHFIRDFWVEAGLDPHTIEVVHNGVDPRDYPFGGLAERARARADLGLPPDAFVVLYFGRIDAEKGAEVLLDAWRRLGIRPETGRLRLVGSPRLTGEGYMIRLRENAPPGCHWLPMRRDVITPLHAADVVVVPSTYDEPFGRAVIEGMATGRPVVTSRVGGMPEILEGDV